MECQYVATQRGGVALVFEGHRYNKVRDGKDGTVYWRCSRDRQCPGRAVTVNNRVKKANNKHNHPPEASLRTGAISVVSSSSSSSQGQHANSNNVTSGITSNSNSNSFTSLSGSNASVATRLSSSKSLSSSSHHHHQQQHHAQHHHNPHHHNIVAHNESSLRLPSSHMTGMPPDMLLDPASAAAAAASFPAIVTETLKYLAAASGNHQMAAAFANSMAQSLNPSLKNMDPHPFRSGNSNRSNQSSHSQAAVHISPDLNDYSEESEEEEELEDLDDIEEEEDQPLNMAIRSSNQCLKKLRSLMRNLHYVPQVLHAYVIPSCDAHQSEYIASCDKRRKFITGFTGSAGTAIVTQDDAALWTDGRYFLQAEKELDSNWRLMREAVKDSVTQSEWLCKVLPPNSSVGVDPMLMPFSSWKTLATSLEESGHNLVPVPENLIDLVWDDRPGPPQNPINPLPDKYTGQSWRDKIANVRQEMGKKKCRALLLTALDDIAYLFNLRGSDIDFNPVFFAYTVVTLDSIYLFVDETKLSAQSRKHLNLDSNTTTPETVELRPYKMIKDFMKWLVTQDNGKIWISRNSSYGLVSIIPEQRRVLEVTPVTLSKAVKNETEIQCMRNAHVKDAVALCEFFAWLEDEIESSENLTEISAADKLEEFRKQQENYVGLSFETISGSGPNGAVIHYKPSQETNRSLAKDEMFLVDSGAQFLDGTTDVTRTVHFGTPSQHQKECFTRVVKGHIALAAVTFPRKTKGYLLDTLARKSLWDAGLDYLHGTGHGIGMYLNVHEGPMGIGQRPHPDDPGLVEGMFLSNEPGYYEDGKFGIRIESIVLVQTAETKHNFNDKGFLRFETVTLVPIQTKLLDPILLTDDEIEWINSYHEKCRDVIGPVLLEQERKKAYKWLMRETQAIG